MRSAHLKDDLKARPGEYVLGLAQAFFGGEALAGSFFQLFRPNTRPPWFDLAIVISFYFSVTMAGLMLLSGNRHGRMASIVVQFLQLAQVNLVGIKYIFVVGPYCLVVFHETGMT